MLVQTSCESAVTSNICSKIRKYSNYSQQPSPLRQLLRPATSVNLALCIKISG